LASIPPLAIQLVDKSAASLADPMILFSFFLFFSFLDCIAEETGEPVCGLIGFLPAQFAYPFRHHRHCIALSLFTISSDAAYCFV
jgi:hypothetical protein